jgi:acyl-CoA thioester hydrolase
MNGETPPGAGSAAYVPSVARLTTRPNDLDSLGHVNHAIVLEYLEAGRWDWFARNGLRRAGVVTPVVARAEVDYRREIFPGELVIATQLLTDAEELAYRVTFQQTITIRQRDAEALAIEGRIHVAFIEMATRRLCSFQEFLETNRVVPTSEGAFPAHAAFTAVTTVS